MTTESTTPVPPDANGLREAVERVRRFIDEYQRPSPYAPYGFLPVDFISEITRTRDRLLVSDLRALLAASEAVPTAGEREACGDEAAHPAHEHRTPAYTGDWKRCDGIPATPPADDASREFTPTMERLRDEYVAMRREHYGFADLYAAEFDRAVADAATRARAEGAAEAGERIARAIEARARRAEQQRESATTATAHDASDEHAWAFYRAASIARSDAAPHTGGQPVDWDSPTWGGGVHHATTDDLGDHGRHADETGEQ